MDGERRDSEQLSELHPSKYYQGNGDKMSVDTALRNDDAPPADSNGASMPPTEPAQNDPYAEQVQVVIHSDIGVQTLLNRLKQSVASAKEFALFLKKRSILEEEHANGLRKISRITHENLRRPEHRQGSFISSYDDITRIHERIADNGSQFAASLHQMHEDLLEMSSHVERGRKHWKQTGLAAEQRLIDTEIAMRKSKAKYDAVAEEYDRARTGDRQSGKIFGLKGPKSAAQHEEDLHRKVQAADADYASKVQVSQAALAELLSKGRPDTVKSLQDLIRECDSALTLQMQKFASFTEKLLLHNGLSISPLKGSQIDQSNDSRSLREAVSAIDNDNDLNQYIASYASKVPARPAEIKYERNPVLIPSGPTIVAGQQNQRQSEPPQSFSSRQGPQQTASANTPTHQSPVGQTFNPAPLSSFQHHERSFSQNASSQSSPYSAGPAVRNNNGQQHGHVSGVASLSSNGPPQLASLPFQSSAPLPTTFQSSLSAPLQPAPPVMTTTNLPPLKPVFGLTLEQLFERDGSAVPMIVYQCIQAVDLYGLEVEGIYRLSGTGSHVTKIRAMFDNDASKVDFRNPENFFHDVNSVAGLLKQFFRDLPDPLLTAEHYTSFIEAAKIEDDIVRRDSLHAIINSLPDPNYATLRAITLHLNRVTENAAANRMNASNLAIVFGPTLMGANTGSNIQDAGWQVRVIDTILNNTYQIFDDD